MAKSYISDLPQVRIHYPLRSLRCAFNGPILQRPYFQTQAYGARSFAVRVAPSLWNRLPVDIKNAPSLQGFF